MKIALRIAAAVALLALVWRSADGAAAMARLRAADPSLLVMALALLSAQLALSALRWSLTARALGQPLGWRTALREYHLGMLLNMTLPGGVLGDVGRALRARAGVGIAAAAQAVVVERLSGQLALAAVLAAGLALWPPAAG
ncbi:MAG: lysylphosphatidylglycerol synthase domain-containing protein, partial [Rubrimonas sp.]